MTSFLFFIAGFLIAVVAMMIVSQRNAAAQKRKQRTLV